MQMLAAKLKINTKTVVQVRTHKKKSLSSSG